MALLAAKNGCHAHVAQQREHASSSAGPLCDPCASPSGRPLFAPHPFCPPTTTTHKRTRTTNEQRTTNNELPLIRATHPQSTGDHQHTNQPHEAQCPNPDASQPTKNPRKPATPKPPTSSGWTLARSATSTGSGTSASRSAKSPSSSATPTPEKSFVALDLAARVSRGLGIPRTRPPETRPGPPPLR